MNVNILNFGLKNLLMIIQKKFINKKNPSIKIRSETSFNNIDEKW